MVGVRKEPVPQLLGPPVTKSARARLYLGGELRAHPVVHISICRHCGQGYSLYMSKVVELFPAATEPVLVQEAYSGPGFSIPRPPAPVLVASRRTVILDPEKIAKARAGSDWVRSLMCS